LQFLNSVFNGDVVAVGSPFVWKQNALKRIIATPGMEVVVDVGNFSKKTNDHDFKTEKENTLLRLPAEQLMEKGIWRKYSNPMDYVSNTSKLSKLMRTKHQLERDKNQQTQQTKNVNQNFEVIKMPYNHSWIEGDNATTSHDSRYYGPVSKSLVWGKVVFGFRDWKVCWTSNSDKVDLKDRIKG
jgi:signal peptidase I